jgi:hypothetical protein
MRFLALCAENSALLILKATNILLRAPTMFNHPFFGAEKSALSAEHYLSKTIALTQLSSIYEFETIDLNGTMYAHLPSKERLGSWIGRRGAGRSVW